MAWVVLVWRLLEELITAYRSVAVRLRFPSFLCLLPLNLLSVFKERIYDYHSLSNCKCVQISQDLGYLFPTACAFEKVEINF